MRHYAFDPCMTTNAFDPTMEMTGNAAHVDCPQCIARLAKNPSVYSDPDEPVREATFRPPAPMMPPPPPVTVERYNILFPVDVYVVDGQITGTAIALGEVSHVEHVRRVLAGLRGEADPAAEGGAS